MNGPESLVTGERDERLARMHSLIESGGEADLVASLSGMHPSDVADLIAELDEEHRLRVVELLPAELASETLAEMEPEDRPEELLASLEPERIGRVIAELSDDDAVDLIGELPPEEQVRVLGILPVVAAGELRRLLQYDEESAGGIMTTEFVAVPVSFDAMGAIEDVRRQARAIGGEDFYTVFVVDRYRRLLGTVSLQSLVVADPASPLGDLVVAPAATVPVEMDQEEVGRIIARYNLPSVAVVGPGGVLLGRVTWDDVVDVLEAEQTEDILRFGGVVSEEEVRGDWLDAIRSRLPWLLLNLGTAAIAASVVWFFEDAIATITTLAVIMPVIAGMGGNAGTQALAVTVRRLALTEESSARRWRVAAKELLVGLVNGAAIGGVAGLVSYALGGNGMLGVVVLMAMWANLIVASFAGAFVPILLERVGADPAVASSIFVTTFTDLAGFFLFLGLASALLL